MCTLDPYANRQFLSDLHQTLQEYVVWTVEGHGIISFCENSAESPQSAGRVPASIICPFFPSLSSYNPPVCVLHTLLTWKNQGPLYLIAHKNKTIRCKSIKFCRVLKEWFFYHLVVFSSLFNKMHACNIMLK